MSLQVWLPGSHCNYHYCVDYSRKYPLLIQRSDTTKKSVKLFRIYPGFSYTSLWSRLKYISSRLTRFSWEVHKRCNTRQIRDCERPKDDGRERFYCLFRSSSHRKNGHILTKFFVLFLLFSMIRRWDDWRTWVSCHPGPKRAQGKRRTTTYQ